MRTQIVELTWDQVDQVVVSELQSAIDGVLTINRDEGGVIIEPDLELLDALQISLAYFMRAADYQVYASNIEHRKNMLYNELME